MSEGGKPDDVSATSREIGKDAADLSEARTRELDVEAGLARVDEQLAELARRRDALMRERDVLHAREVADEREIMRDAALLKDELGDGGGAPGPLAPPAPSTYAFFVDGKEYTTDQARMTGRQIEAKVPDWDPSHDLVLESHGGEPDRPIRDDEVVDFATAPAPLHFSSAPKANFGLS